LRKPFLLLFFILYLLWQAFKILGDNTLGIIKRKVRGEERLFNPLKIDYF